MEGNKNRKDAQPRPPQSNFQLPYDPQAESRLLQLPAEFRVKIFCSLLKSYKPLEPLRGVYPKRPQKSTQLNAQLLRACQKVYTECLPILYQENTLVINFFATGDCLRLLGVRLQYPSSLHYYRVHGLPMHLLEYATMIDACPPYPVCSSDQIHAKYIVQIYPALKRFRRIQVKIDPYAPQEAYFIMCRALQDLLFGKDVHFATSHPSQDSTADTSRLALSPCRYLRCCSIVFRGWEGSTADLIKTITSTDVVNDTFPIYQELKRQKQYLPLLVPHAYPSVCESFRMLAEAVMSYDVGRTQKETRVILSLWIGWYSIWARSKKAEEPMSEINIDMYRDRAIEQLLYAINNGTLPHLEYLGEL
ncbi:hypothetical protein LTR70_006415 [Exophiala xenobiotica]|uniref:Uncharacterized protein n=1 Tax=Lithohypha guttulata TaxID=1690604 RepID=A0ABR0K3E4_9EURO|nr:hypothetical protein LTR24_007384 [Lithohypha guttulata]KAK5316247.1 hypothetical protein LTR70_006415 [Exophiala xenobiotica]